MTPLVQLSGVSHIYGSARAVDGIDLTVGEAESWGIAGPSGSGKSTLARILTLHLRPSAGTVQLLGVAAESYGASGIRAQRRRFQLVFQDPADTFDHRWETWQVVAEADAIAGRDRSQQMKRAGQLAETVQLPRKCLTRSPLELSGGERRRVAIARALGANPSLLLLDESFSGLDGCVQGELLQLLDQLRNELRVSVVQISHDLRLLRRASEQILILDRGRVVESGPTDGVLGAPRSEMTRKLLRASDWRAR